MVTIPTPQAIGAFPYPSGLLLLPSGYDELRHGLLQGKLPQEWPAELTAIGLAFAGQPAEAASMLKSSAVAIDRFNLFVLEPEAISRETVAAALPEEWHPLIDYVAFTAGLTAIPPADTSPIAEVSALTKTALAAAELDDGDRDAAVALLREASDQLEDSPAFRGLVLSEIAGHGGTLDEAEQALSLLTGTDLPVALAEAKYHRAGLIHGLALEGRKPISQAIIGYTDALHGLNETEHRPLYARLHLNLGTAYLAAPMATANDGMRAGMAISSLRTALANLDSVREEQEYAAATLNLANALVYAPSSKRRDNLMEAVDLYEKLLELRPVEIDPLGRARALSNQGNALAHLGFLGDAQQRLLQAKALFVAAGDLGSSEIVEGLLTDLQRSDIWAGELSND